MIIQSKYESICPVCEKKINIGDSIEWIKGEKTMHQTCSENLTKQAEEKHNNKPYRMADRVEIIEDIHKKVGVITVKETEEIICCAGAKGEIIGEDKDIRTGDIILTVQEIVRKGQQPKTKSGYVKVRLNQIKITKKAKFQA